MHTPRPLSTRRGLLQLRCTEHLLYVLTLLLNIGTLALMFYALLWEVGNLVDLPDTRIGFYNFCLWNDIAGELQCLKNEQLQAMGISLAAIALARVFVYTSLVLSMFHPICVLNAKCEGERKGWKMILITHCIKMIILAGGLSMFLSQTLQWIHLSDFTGGFWALLGAMALLLLQILIATVFLNRAKHTHKHTH
uniref:Transmembrane protein 140 n=1 Tax=Malurus cyaneus samueli TaxID=2593467 RepID=A0A8C5TVX4_9PASS